MEQTTKYEVLSMKSIVPSTTHIQELRRARFHTPEGKRLLQELADSIKQVNVLQPILARPHPKAHGKFQIVAGERRWLAAELAGLSEIPASIGNISDEQVLEVQLIENLQRSELHELEEAEGYEELMKLKKISADAVADMIGRDRSYVYKRTKLLALCQEARKAFYAGELDASRALLIARIGHPDLQRQAMKDIMDRRFRDPMTYREAQEHIQSEYMLKLKDAPFDTADAQLVPKAGSCQACPKRTGNQKELFADVKSGDICTDPKCFDEKRQAVYFIAVKDLQAKGKKVLHGDAAKKVFPHWKNGSSSMSQAYVGMNDTVWSGSTNRKISHILGESYEPILVQHPATGKILEVATQQAVAKATKDPERIKKAAKAAKARTPQGPDVDEALLARLVKLIHEKAPKELGKPYLAALVERLMHHLNTRSEERQVVALQWGWPKGAFTGSGYYQRNKLPKPAAKLDARGLVLLMIELTFLADRYQRKHLLDLFGINEAKTRELIIAERKAAAKAAREAKKARGK